MEAFSLGIPVIATDVGGVKEIVDDHKNGLLLADDITSSEICSALEEIMKLSDEDYQEYRVEARRTWEKNWNSDNNYRNFADLIFDI